MQIQILPFKVLQVSDVKFANHVSTKDEDIRKKSC